LDRASVFGTDTQSAQVLNQEVDREFPLAARSACAARSAKELETEEPYADLAQVIKAWPDLPEAIKAGILAMIKTASHSCTWRSATPDDA